MDNTEILNFVTVGLAFIIAISAFFMMFTDLFTSKKK